MIDEKQVVVVGGGPVGLYAALQLQRAGYLCTVLEKGLLPHDKLCGGGMPPAVRTRLYKLGIQLGGWCYRDLHIYFPPTDERVVHLKHVGMEVLPRRWLSEALLRCALDHGVTVLANSPVLAEMVDVPGHAINLPTVTVPYKHLILASGASGLARSLIGRRTPQYQLKCVQRQIVCPGFNQLATGWTHQYGPNYSWAFSAGDDVLVGTCGPKEVDLEASMAHWLSTICLPDVGQNARWLIPCDYQGVSHDDDISLVGDAAGMASVLTGEGLHQGMASADAVVGKITGRRNDRDLKAVLRQKWAHARLWDWRRSSRRHCKMSNRLFQRMLGTSVGQQYMVRFLGLAE